MDPSGQPPPYEEQKGAYPPQVGAYPPQPYPQQPYPQQPFPQQPYPQQPYPQQPYPQQPYPAGPTAQMAPPPPAAGMQPAVVVAQPMVLGPHVMREAPVSMTCPGCQATIVTATHYDTGTLTWLACVGLCVVGCDFGCCLIPFCVDGLKDVVHTCPNCKRTVGTYRRL